MKLKATTGKLFWIVKGTTWSCEILKEACPMCGKFTLVGLPDPIRKVQPDGTNIVCHPSIKGCNQGYEVEVRGVLARRVIA